MAAASSEEPASLVLLQKLEQRVADQANEISLLSVQLRQVRLQADSASAAPTPTARRSAQSPSQAAASAGGSGWQANEGVRVSEDGVISRVGDDVRSRAYVFRGAPLALYDSFTFVMEQLSSCDGSSQDAAAYLESSLSFGVTIHAPEHVMLESLPINSQVLTTMASAAGNWFVASNILPKPGEWRVARITRRANGVWIKRGSSVDGKTTEKLLFDLDPFIRVHAFLHFDGCISSTRLRGFTARPRPLGSFVCLVCHTAMARMMAKKCGHLLYCSNCFVGARVCADGEGDVCPVCRLEIKKFKQIRND